MRLNFPRCTKRRLPARLRQPLKVAAAVNQVWSLDFMSDGLYDGRRFRTLNVLDEGVREALAIEIDTSLPAKRVVRVLERLVDWRGAPLAIRLDNGPELLATEFVTWCERRGIELRYIQPGNPDQNAFIERFNRSDREEVLGPTCCRSRGGAPDHARLVEKLQRGTTTRCAGKPAASDIP